VLPQLPTHVQVTLPPPAAPLVLLETSGLNIFVDQMHQATGNPPEVQTMSAGGMLPGLERIDAHGSELPKLKREFSETPKAPELELLQGCPFFKEPQVPSEIPSDLRLDEQPSVQEQQATADDVESHNLSELSKPSDASAEQPEQQAVNLEANLSQAPQAATPLNTTEPEKASAVVELLLPPITFSPPHHSQSHASPDVGCIEPCKTKCHEEIPVPAQPTWVAARFGSRWSVAPLLSHLRLPTSWRSVRGAGRTQPILESPGAESIAVSASESVVASLRPIDDPPPLDSPEMAAPPQKCSDASNSTSQVVEGLGSPPAHASSVSAAEHIVAKVESDGPTLTVPHATAPSAVPDEIASIDEVAVSEAVKICSPVVLSKAPEFHETSPPMLDTATQYDLLTGAVHESLKVDDSEQVEGVHADMAAQVPAVKTDPGQANSVGMSARSSQPSPEWEHDVDGMRPEFMRQQERIRAEWFARLAATDSAQGSQEQPAVGAPSLLREAAACRVDQPPSPSAKAAADKRRVKSTSTSKYRKRRNGEEAEPTPSEDPSSNSQVDAMSVTSARRSGLPPSPSSMGPGPALRPGPLLGPGPALIPGPSLGPGPSFGPGPTLGPPSSLRPGPSFGPGERRSPSGPGPRLASSGR